jgi:Pectate lyase superfamily protein
MDGIGKEIRRVVPSRRTLLTGTLAGATGFAALAAASPALAASSATGGAAKSTPKANAAANDPNATAYAPGSGWINVVTQYQADPTGGTDSTAAIQAALDSVPASGAVVYLPAGIYAISDTLTATAKTTIQGDGDGATVITQSSTTANGIQSTDGEYLTISDLYLSGPGSGSGVGINLVLSANTNIPYTSIRRVTVSSWGSDGVYVIEPIVSQFDTVVSADNGGDGFHMDANAASTSLRFSSCYANGNAGAGYSLLKGHYSVLEGCAADSNGNGYVLTSCKAITLTGCGAESQAGDSFVFQSGWGNCLVGAWVYGNNASGIVVASGEFKLTLIGCSENTPSASATAFINAAAGTGGALLNVINHTANVLPITGWTTLA